MDITSLFTIVEKHGVSLVISSVVIFFLFRFGNLGYKILESRFLNKENGAHDESTLKKTIENDDRVREAMLKILYEVGADRILVFYYHNGIRDLKGLGYLRVSVLYEVVRYGIKPASQFLTNMPIATTTFWNKEIIQRKQIECEDTGILKETDPTVYEHLKGMGVKSFFVNGWYDENGSPKGFIHISFCKEKKVLSDKEKSLVESLSYIQ